MGRRRSNKKDKDEEGSETGGGSGSGSDRGTGCVQQVKKLVGMYTPNRKANSNMSVMKTPGSTSAFAARRMGPPRSVNFPQTPKSERFRPTTPSDLREHDAIQVYCRIKPLGAEESCLKIQGDAEVALIPPDNPVYWRQNQAKQGYYTFSRVFDESQVQKTIFDHVALPLVNDFIQGKNALLFAYGVTGSGKTYTMSGTSKECGIMPRCLDVIFNSIGNYKADKFVFKPDRLNGFESQSKADAFKERQTVMNAKIKESGRLGTPRMRPRNAANEEDFATRSCDTTSVPVTSADCFYSVFLTHIEIYNNMVYDLLDETPIEMGKKVVLQSKMLREGSNRNVYVNGVTEIEVESPEEAFEIFQRGLRRRRNAHTALNTESSRSHSVFNIRLVRAPSDSEGEEVSDNKDHIHVSQLSLVDLAGSERYSRTQATGDRLKEAGNINNSLMTLRKCMDILRENQQTGMNKVVSFRESKLTHFLKNYFEGEGRVKMILCVNPRPDDYDENIHVLSFAEQVQEVQITRPQERKVIDTQTPGRNKANELYKESVRQLVEENVIREFDLPRTDTGFVFLNLPIPICHITQSNQAEVLATLKKALELRVRGNEELRIKIRKEQEAFRAMLVLMESENETLKIENTTYIAKVEVLTEEKNRSEIVLRQLMTEKNSLQQKCDGMEEELADLRMQFRQRDVQHFKEKELLKSDLDLQRELGDLKRKRELHREEKKMKAEFKQKEKTLAKVRELVSSVDIHTAETTSKRSSRSRQRVLDLDASFSSTCSEPERISTRRSTRTRAPSEPSNLNGGTPLGFSQIRKELGIPNSRPRPRARSTDQDVWLEHVTGLATKEGTVMQPNMKKKRSVTKLTSVEDIASKASKYCLRTAEQDSEGEIETRLYKGDVLNTVGGGAQVVFNDVEVLRQESPTHSHSPTRKRRSSGGAFLGGIVSGSPFRNRSNVFDENAETVAERCRQGIGSTMMNKRHRPM